MTIGSDYPRPVYVNGFQCWNCTEVAEAKKDIDPARPAAGPGGAEAGDGSANTRNAQAVVRFGGALAGTPDAAGTPSRPSSAAGAKLDISV